MISKLKTAAVIAWGVAIAIVAAWWHGRSSGVAGVEAKQTKAYRDERKEIDNADLGLGASDSERIDRLRDIAGKR